MQKEWKPIKGYEHIYSVSNTGEVKSLPRKKGFMFRKTHLVLKQKTTKHGYKSINLLKNNKHKVFFVHRLVALAFVDGQTEERKYINHKDGNKQNNNANNLEWCTPKENMHHALAMGLKTNDDIQGEKHGRSKLTNTQAMEILKSNKTYTELANIYKISKATISLIKTRKKWKILDKL